MKVSSYLRFLFLVGGALFAQALDGNAESSNVEASQPLTGSAWKQSLAFAQARSLAITDEEFRSIVQSEIADLLLAKGDLVEATELARTIPGYRRGITLGKIAAAYGRRSGPETVELISEAIAITNLPHPWQIEAIQAECAVAYATLGNDAKFQEITTKLTEKSALIRAKSGKAVEQVRRGESSKEPFFETNAEKQLAPELLIAANALLEICQFKMNAAQDDQTRAAVLEMISPMQAILQASHAVSGEEYLDLGIFYRNAGDLKKSAQMISIALQQMPIGGDLSQWRAGYLARLASLYHQANEPAKVDAIFVSALDGTSVLHRFYQPPAYCQVAEAQVAVGRLNEAEASWGKALAISSENPNLDSQHLGAAQVATSMARAGVNIPEKLVGLLAGKPAKDISVR